VCRVSPITRDGKSCTSYVCLEARAHMYPVHVEYKLDAEGAICKRRFDAVVFISFICVA
jgi:hypothetical protein